MRKEYGNLFYISLALVVVIIINTIILSLKSDTEHFADGQQSGQQGQGLIKVETRPCTLHLTNDNDLCEKLADIYKMSELQIQVQMNKMQDIGNQASYDMMKYVKENKKNLPINACKIELQKFKEVRNMYGSSNINVHKNIYRNLNYNTETLSGYCLSDVTEYSGIDANLDSSNILNILRASVSSNLFVPPTFDNSVGNIVDDANSRYRAIRVQNKIPLNTLMQDSPNICKDVNVALENNLKFLRLHCSLLKETQLVVDKIDLVSYDQLQRKFQIIDDGSRPNSNIVLDSYFTYVYDKRQIMYQPTINDAIVYKLTYDYCNKIEAYTVFDNLKFSMAEFRIMPKMIKQNIELDSTSTVATSNAIVASDVPTTVNNMMMNIISDNRKLEQTLLTYTSNQDVMLAEISKLRREICPSIVTNNNNKAMCILRANAMEDEYNLLEVQKFQVKDVLTKQRSLYQTFLETSYKIKAAKYTLFEINEMIKLGVTVSYTKYADMISNDDYLYLQV
jgi:hypothetical protein